MKKILLITLLLIVGCKEKVREEIIERFPTGEKKLVVTYQGTGYNEKVIDRVLYFKDGAVKTVDTTFYSNGSIETYTEKKDGNRFIVINFYENGVISNLDHYNNNGKIHGESITNVQVGDKLLTVTKNYKNGKLSGKWIGYGLDGNLSYIRYYHDGILQMDESYAHNGKVYRKIFYENGEASDTLEYLDALN